MDDIYASFVAQRLVFVLETGGAHDRRRALYHHYDRVAIRNEGEPYSRITTLYLLGYDAVKVIAGAVDHGPLVVFVTQDLVRV